jgi:hypothetical protein
LIGLSRKSRDTSSGKSGTEDGRVLVVDCLEARLDLRLAPLYDLRTVDRGAKILDADLVVVVAPSREERDDRRGCHDVGVGVVISNE